MSLDATPSGPAADSYVSVAVATAYFAGRLFATAWGGAILDTQERALKQATSWLDALAWLGVKTAPAQRLAWPRAWAPMQEPGLGVIGGSRTLSDDRVQYWPSTAVPRPIVEATCELALALMIETADPTGRDAGEGIIREKVGPLETEYAAPLVRKQGLARYPAVWTRIQPLLRHAQGGTVTRG